MGQLYRRLTDLIHGDLTNSGHSSPEKLGGGGSCCFRSMLMLQLSHEFSTSSLQFITSAFLLYSNSAFSVKIGWHAFAKSKFGSCSCSEILLTLDKTSATNVEAEGITSPSDQVNPSCQLHVH